jgi:hypothetical protein
MKRILGFLLVGFIINHARAQTEHEWKVTLKVVTETGQPVTGAKARVYYLMTNEIAGLTDSNGVFVASHHDGSENLGFQAEKRGHYPFRIMHHMGRNYKPEKWNPVQTVVLKRIIKPIPMYAKSVNLGMPIFDKPAGFDLTIGDWVGPYGKGINSDIIFTTHREKRAENDSDYQLTVSFPKTGDGIQEFTTPSYYLHDRGSELLSSEEAPSNGYQPEWIQTKTRRPGKPMESNWDEYRNYYFRVRTKVDDRGNIVSAHYGKIYGDFMQFKYYLNPTINDRNVEFDPEQNLMKNLKFNEGVEAP